MINIAPGFCILVCNGALGERGDSDAVSLESFPQDLGAVSGRRPEVTTVGELNNLEERMDILLLQEVLRE